MRIGAISPSGEQLAPARCLVIHGFVRAALRRSLVNTDGVPTCDF
jgi:hypothetical protein